MRRMQLNILLLMMLIGQVGWSTMWAVKYAGTCGASGYSMNWSLDTEGRLLKISGSGNMQNYSSGTAPWYPYREHITYLQFYGSVKTIGDYAFAGCTDLTIISLQEDLTTIGAYAFSNCKMAVVTIPTSVTTIGNRAFYNCTSLTEIRVGWTTSNTIPPWIEMSPTSGVKLVVPCGTNSTYKNKNGWKSYAVSGNTQYTITVRTEASAKGKIQIGNKSAAISGTYKDYCGATVSIKAIPSTGYKFTKWDDGNTSNPRTVTISEATTYTAKFEQELYTISVVSNNSSYGSVSGGGSLYYGYSTTITATPSGACYQFVRWDDGNTTNPRQVTATGNKTYKAIFALTNYTVTVTANNAQMGDVNIKVLTQ